MDRYKKIKKKSSQIFSLYFLSVFFLFSILGMHLFGCKFGSERDGDTLPDRKNFDSLLWAIVTVFQVSRNMLNMSDITI